MTIRRRSPRLRLKRDQAIIWLPPRASGERALAGSASLLVMRAVPAGALAVSREDSAAPLLSRASLETLPALRSVYLVFDARDVTVLKSVLPKLSGARLARAIPGLLEDQVLQDPMQCAWALDPLPLDSGERRIGVVDANWLETVVQAFERRKIKVLAAWPLQAVMQPPSETSWLIGLPDSLAWCAASGDSLGWSAAPTESERSVQCAGAVDWAASVGAPVERYWMGDPVWQSAFDSAMSSARPIPTALSVPTGPVPLAPLSWPQPSSLDLLAARRVAGGMTARLGRLDWRAWRAVGAWAIAALLLTLVGLNLEWGRLLAEERRLAAHRSERFTQVMGTSTPMVDPLIQMNRQLALYRQRAGQADPDGFVPMLAKVAEALGTSSGDALLGVQYREGQLSLRLRPPLVQSAAARDRLIEACRLQGLEAVFESGREGFVVVKALR